MAKLLLRRITVSSVMASVPAFFVASVMFGVDVLDRTWATHRDLELWMTWEILLIHAFAFLGMAAAVRPKTWRGHIFRVLGAGFLLTLYCSAAYSEDGWSGIAVLFGLGLATYCGLFFRRPGDPLFMHLGVRWMMNTLTLIFGVGLIVALFVQIVLGHSQPGLTTEPWIGICYFFVLGCYELFRLYDALIKRSKPSRKRGQSVSTTA